MRVRQTFCVLALSMLVAARPVAAQRAMTIVDLLNLANVGDPQVSPDGRQLLYTQSETDWKNNRRVTHVWRVDRDGTGAIQLTRGERGESGARWSPDGRTIAVVARRGDDEASQIYLISNQGGEARRLTSHETAVRNLSWSPDGSAIYFLAADPKPKEQQQKEKAKDDVYAFDEDFQQQHLWKALVTTGAAERVTSGDFTVSSYRLSRDGARIAHHRTPNPLFGDAERGEVWIMDTSGANALQLTRNTVPESGATLSPDNSTVLFLSGSNATFETYYNANVFVVPAAGGPARDLTSAVGDEVTSADWSKDGRAIYYVANMGVHTQLFEMPAEGGSRRQLTDGQHTLGHWSFAHSPGVHVFGLDGPSNAGDIWMMAPGGKPEQATHVFDHLAKDFKLPRQERISWKGADGVTVEGLVYYPLDYAPGRRCPLVVQTHGGPQASDKFEFGRWSDFVQVLAGMGYMVFKPNYRGSTGYGDEVLRDMVRHYFQNAHLDVMTGVDHLISLGLADPDRMAKMGWSGGGHMTNKIITFTGRFKAAASGAGAANWISMYGQSDVRTYRTPWFGGTPWQKDAPIDVYWEHSPLKYAANVTTPTIFLVGEQDVRVPMAQSVEMFRALRSNGVPTRLYVAPREPHGWQELRHELFQVNVHLDWFERHVMDRAYTWEVAPGEKTEVSKSAGGPGL
ncbi:MAG: S9 family peptidase [Acidobacteriota bacterium]